jgi:hypothetical protein
LASWSPILFSRQSRKSMRMKAAKLVNNSQVQIQKQLQAESGNKRGAAPR